MNDYDQLIKNAITTDCLSDAERLTGQSYKTSKETESIGLILHLNNVQDRNRLLKLTDDTTHSNALADYLRIAFDERFVQVQHLRFVGKNNEQESMYFLFHPRDAILLVFETYGENHVNGGKFYYCWKPNSNKPEFGRHLSSGGWKEIDGQWFYGGDHDCREALRFHLRELRSLGSFVNPWVVDNHLWLCNYMDCDGSYDSEKYKAINRARLALLPHEVRKAINKP